MARWLFLTWSGAGNQGPSIGLARELAARGHDVVFAGYSIQRDLFESRSLDLVVLPRSDATYAREQGRGDMFAALAAGVWGCVDHLEDVPEAVAATRCDGVVVDCLMLGALAALEGTDIPTLVLVHTAPGALAPPGGPFEALVLGALDGVRDRAGLAPIARMWDAWAPFGTIVTSIPELDPLADEVPESFAYLGPIADRPPSPAWVSTWPADDPRPLVVASFSTGPAWDQTSRLQRTLTGLEDRPVHVLALTGTTALADLQVPPNAHAQPFVPHGEVLGSAAAVVTHAGHGTVCAALSHGVPLVCLPNPAADQPALAAQVARLGAGVTLDGERATEHEVADAVMSVAGRADVRAAVTRLADRIAGSPGVSGAADMVESSRPG